MIFFEVFIIWKKKSLLFAIFHFSRLANINCEQLAELLSCSITYFTSCPLLAVTFATKDKRGRVSDETVERRSATRNRMSNFLPHPPTPETFSPFFILFVFSLSECHSGLTSFETKTATNPQWDMTATRKVALLVISIMSLSLLVEGKREITIQPNFEEPRVSTSPCSISLLWIFDPDPSRWWVACVKQ